MIELGAMQNLTNSEIFDQLNWSNPDNLFAEKASEEQIGWIDHYSWYPRVVQIQYNEVKIQVLGFLPKFVLLAIFKQFLPILIYDF